MIIAIYLSFIFVFMNFVTGPLVWPLERSKQRPSLRECTILLRKSMNIYGNHAIIKILNKMRYSQGKNVRSSTQAPLSLITTVG